jgi:acetyl-CoA carboxylase carboxyltransferase component
MSGTPEQVRPPQQVAAMGAELRVLDGRIGHDYHLIPVQEGRHTFLRPLFDAFDASTLRFWTDRSVNPADFDRIGCDGLVTGLGEWDGRVVAVAWSDFRVNGAAYGRSNSQRFAAFLRYLHPLEPEIPLVYMVNSAGVSVMEDRVAFTSAFGIWPALLDYSEDRLVLTCASRRCLGLAPLLFGLGHYRVAIAEETQVNLTGPDVIRMFFGAGFDFDQHAAAERCLERHDLIHEVVPNTGAALRLFRDVIRRSRGPVRTLTVPELGPDTGPLLDRVLDDPPLELVPGWCRRVRLFLGTRMGRPLGVFINPLERSNNLITVRTLDKYAAGLDLFRALGVPIVSLLDSPGLDPRFDQSDAGNIRRILSVGERIIRYPHGSMGVVVGRCYGGATTLAFPRVFGGNRALVLKDARVGVMDDRILADLLSASPRLLARWQAQVARRGPEFQDLLDEGTVDVVIEPEDLPGEVDRFLASRDDEPLGLQPDTVRLAGSARHRARPGPLREVS